SFDELSRLRCLRASTKRSGDRRAANTEHSRGIRSPCNGTQFARNGSRNDRSEEDRLGRSGEVLCRSGIRKDSAYRVALKRLWSRTSQANRPKSRGQEGRGRQPRKWGRRVAAPLGRGFGPR